MVFGLRVERIVNHVLCTHQGYFVSVFWSRRDRRDRHQVPEEGADPILRGLAGQAEDRAGEGAREVQVQYCWYSVLFPCIQIRSIANDRYGSGSRSNKNHWKQTIISLVASAVDLDPPDPYHFPGSGSVEKFGQDPKPLYKLSWIRIQQKPL